MHPIGHAEIAGQFDNGDGGTAVPIGDNGEVQIGQFGQGPDYCAQPALRSHPTGVDRQRHFVRQPDGRTQIGCRTVSRGRRRIRHHSGPVAETIRLLEHGGDFTADSGDDVRVANELSFDGAHGLVGRTVGEGLDEFGHALMGVVERSDFPATDAASGDVCDRRRQWNGVMDVDHVRL